MSLTDQLRAGLTSDAAGDRPAGVEIHQTLEPAGGLPVWPPSYEGRLEIHDRHLDGEVRRTIELDTVGSSANRLEEVLLDLHRSGQYPLPVSDTKVPSTDGPITITTLEAPHRMFDAWLRLSVGDDGETAFEATELGRALSGAHPGALDPLLETSAHDLLLGVWDSHRKGPHGQVRIARALTSSVIGLDPVEQASFAARRDPLNLGEASEIGPAGERLSKQGLSSVPPQKSIPYEEGRDGRPKGFGGRIADHRGGVSITSARYQGYLSFPALRRLRFVEYDDVDVRVMLASLALYSVALRCAEGWDLRARCTLVAAGAPEFRLVHADGRRETIAVTVASARALFDSTVAAVEIKDRSVHLQAGAKLEKLVQASIASSAKA